MDKSKIPIRNIYYMMTYAYKALDLSEYKNAGTEDFDNIIDFYTEILLMGLPTMIRSGLIKDYVNKNEQSSIIKGKIDINSTIKQNSLINKKLVINYDEYSEDILLNQIIKATIMFLLKSNEVKKDKRKKLIGLLPYFNEVSNIELNDRIWDSVKFNRNSIRYKFIIHICNCIYNDLLMSNKDDLILNGIIDQQRLALLFEKFVFNFYKKETNYSVSCPKIKWKIDDGYSEALPSMETDIVIKHKDITIIIDTKFYTNNMNKRYEDSKEKQISNNMYQIYSYVNNWDKRPNEIVKGVLLYAKTTADVQPNHHYQIGGNSFSVLNVDLDQDFNEIKRSLFELLEIM